MTPIEAAYLRSRSLWASIFIHWIFDPDYDTYDLAHFEPVVLQVFDRQAYSEKVLQQSVMHGLP
ncbi:CPBP family intramembrane glutamic endopeptidase [Leptothoe sp. PORK10 BA2]|uniref:CPBP family intramembrane glutamic endopeptidase n=1 Tax=Leptothoe sp. PORK10 BA2 TaxID=3110254 RepID=UPI002B1EDB6F|nr:CPBP family intramembrane glutamic endopeptidase [Leptothoe sp. PORK10 BA2]MEA5464804.1 CPBP family intramembrane glutamic endopeptidase [Leptothoe sp. PORK10 BA2]